MIAWLRVRHVLGAMLTSCVLAMVLSGCSTLSRLVFEKPHAELSSVKVSKLSLNELDIELALILENPNSFALTIESLEYSLAAMGAELGQGKMGDKVVIEGGSVRTLRVPFRLSPIKAMQLAAMMVDKPSALNVKMTGSAKLSYLMGTFHFDFSEERSVNL